MVNKMITFYFDSDTNVPKYEQLYRHIKKLIQHNELKKDEKLPSKRKLAQHLKVSVVTVETCYMQLLAEGYIFSKPKSGFYVEGDINHFFSHEGPKNRLLPKPKESIPYRVDFRTNDVDTLHSPYQYWRKIENELTDQELNQMINQRDSQGIEMLRVQIAKYLYQYRGIESTPNQIVIGAGSEYLLGLIILLVGRSHVFALENPGYLKIQSLYQAHQIQIQSIPLDDNGFDIHALENTSTSICHVSPSHQFPTGKVMPISRRIALLDWANQSKNRYIIEDDYDSEFRFQNSPIPAMKSLDFHDHVIYLNSFSKSIAPSLRMSYMVLPTHLVQKYQNELANFSSSVSVYNQVIVAKMMEKGLFERHLNKMKSIYKEKRDQLIHEIKTSRLSAYVQIIGSEAGLHFLIEVNLPFSEQELVEKAQNQQVRVYGMYEFELEPLQNRKQKFLVIGYSNYDIIDFKVAIQLLEKAWLGDEVNEYHQN